MRFSYTLLRSLWAKSESSLYYQLILLLFVTAFCKSESGFEKEVMWFEWPNEVYWVKLLVQHFQKSWTIAARIGTFLAFCFGDLMPCQLIQLWSTNTLKWYIATTILLYLLWFMNKSFYFWHEEFLACWVLLSGNVVIGYLWKSCQETSLETTQVVVRCSVWSTSLVQAWWSG